MLRYRVFVFVGFLFLSSVINFDKKCANSTQRSQSPNSQRLTIVSGKSKIYSPRQGYLSPGNSIVLVIAATLLFISVTIFCRFWGSFCRNSSTLPTDLFMRYHKNSPRITFQHMYANLLSSKITQHDKFTKAGNFTEIFSSETFIETSNIFAIRGKKPFLFQLHACKRNTQSQSICN